MTEQSWATCDQHGTDWKPAECKACLKAVEAVLAAPLPWAQSGNAPSLDDYGCGLCGGKLTAHQHEHGEVLLCDNCGAETGRTVRVTSRRPT